MGRTELTCEYINQRQLYDLRHGMVLVFGISVDAPSICLFRIVSLYTEKDQFLKVKSWAVVKSVHVLSMATFSGTEQTNHSSVVCKLGAFTPWSFQKKTSGSLVP